MTATTSAAPAAPAVDTPAVTVDTLLHEACVAGATMTAKSKEAAKLAAAELDNTVASVAERVKKVVDAHATAFGDNHNVKAIFSDCLWLLAVPAAVVESKVAGEKTPKSFTAAQSIDLSKHALRDCAKQVREQEGAGRAAGGGAKPKAAPVAAAPVAPAATPDSVFYTLLSQKLKDAGEFAKIVKALEDAGYTVAKKGKKVAAAATTVAAAAPAPTLAEQLAAAAPSKAAAILAAA